MRRGGSLKRKTPLRARRMRDAIATFGTKAPGPRRKSKHARRLRDLDFMGWVKRQRCVATVITPPGRHPHQVRCEGPIEADHAGDRFAQGDGIRAHDATCIPLCRLHHRDRTDRAGVFAFVSKPDHRAWCDRAIAYTQRCARLVGLLGGPAIE